VLRLGLKPFIPLPQLIDRGGEFVDPLHALAQQKFQPLGILRLDHQFAAELYQLAAQPVVLSL